MRTPLLAIAIALVACSRPSGTATTTSAKNEAVPRTDVEDACHLIEEGFGPDGTTAIRVEKVVEGLVVPWSIAFLPNRDMLVSERPGRIRHVKDGVLEPRPIANVPVLSQKESGLLGLALHPKFADNGQLFVYYTAKKGDGKVNRIARYTLDPSTLAVRETKVIFDGIAAETRHDGGRLRFGADGMLYVGTGDAGEPKRSQDVKNPAGKLLRLTPDGSIPDDNPIPKSPAFLLGIRNVQAFDWLDDGRIILADHGPSGDLRRSGHDEVSIAPRGANLGWPGTWGCERKEGVVTPILVFREATPPGGGVLYRGDAIPAWKGSFLVATLASKHLQRIEVDPVKRRVVKNEVYLRDQFGRLRDVVTGPDGAVYVTTSNCDGRGDCPERKDAILRITAQ